MMNIESGGHTSFSRFTLSFLNLNCFFIKETERSSASEILPNSQTSQKPRYLKFFICLVDFTVLSLPFFSMKKKKKRNLLLATKSPFFEHLSKYVIIPCLKHLSRCIAWLGNSFNTISDLTALFHTSASCTHLVTTILQKTQLYRIVSSSYLCDSLLFRLHIR